MEMAITTLQSRGIDSSEVELVYNLTNHGTIWGKCAALNGCTVAGALAAGPPGYAAGCVLDSVVGTFIIANRCSAMVDEAAAQAHRVQRAIGASIKRFKVGFHVLAAGSDPSKWWSLRTGHEEEGFVFVNGGDSDVVVERLVVRNVRSPVVGCVRLRAQVSMGAVGEDWYLCCSNQVVRLRPPGEIPDFGLVAQRGGDADFRPKFGVSGEETLALESAAHPGWFVARGDQDEPLELHQVSSFEADSSQETRLEVQRISWVLGDLSE